MVLLVILFIIVYLWYLFKPDIDITREKDVLLFYNWDNSRKYIKLFRWN